LVFITMAFKNLVSQNLIKNLLIIIIAAFFWSIISASLQPIQVDQLGNFLMVVSILLVTVCFANFAFTYEKSRFRTLQGGILSHLATFSFMLLILLLLESMVLAIKIIYPSLYPIILGFSVLLYAGIMLYDFWDISRYRSSGV